jgi:hypothetical protein
MVHLMVLELLADAPDIAGGKVQPLPTEGRISALNIPHSSIVFDLHQVTEIQAELLGGNGVATEKIKHANLVSFTCLKSFAFDQRFERKDAHDLIYCIEHAPEGIGCRRRRLLQRSWLASTAHVIQASLAILRNRFAQDEKTEGYRKDGPVSVAKFELGEGDEPEQREARALRQRQASDVIEQLLARATACRVSRSARQQDVASAARLCTGTHSPRACPSIAPGNHGSISCEWRTG